MAIIIIQIKRNYPWNMEKNKFISSLIVIVLMNIFNPFSVLGFENEIKKSKYINKGKDDNTLNHNFKILIKIH